MIYGGVKLDESIPALERTVILNPKKDSKLSLNEVFGPILKIYSYNSIDEVISEITSQEKPLSIYFLGSVLNNPRRKLLESHTSSGQFTVNEVCN